MVRKFAIAVAGLSLAAGVSVFGSPARAQGVQVGVLTCNVPGGFGFIFGSSRAVNCTFAPASGSPQHYDGSIDKLGVDIGNVRGGMLIWSAVAPTASVAPGSLAGTYGGATGSATVGAGLGANVLVGGSGNTIVLQPVSIQGTTGLNVAAGVAAMTLTSSAMAAADVGGFITILGNQAIEVIRSNRILTEKLAYFQLLLREDFDLPGISRFLLGPYWRVASEAERQEFQNLLPDHLVRSYLRRLADYNFETLEVTGARTEPSAALVTSQLIQAGGPPIQLVWRLDVRGDRYKNSDVSINGLSMALSQRETLAKMIQRHGRQVAGLLEAMRAGETGEISQISPDEVRWASAWRY